MSRLILIVDDNFVNRSILKRLLRDEYDIIEAENGEKALAVLEARRGELSAVLLDLMMPVMDGYEVLRRMTQNPALAQVPVIVATGSADSQTELNTLALGAQDFIAKPYNPAIVRQRLSNVIWLRETAAMMNLLRTDSLTGLFSREYFYERAAELISQREPGYYVLSALDIDNFKVINDQYGNEKGDEVLKAIAEYLKSEPRLSGGVCCRMSADNFAALYPAQNMVSGERELRAYDTAVAAKMPLSVTISTGRYIVTDKSLGVSAMYDRAILAKSTVKGRFDAHMAVYDESMRKNLLQIQEIIDEMDAALIGGQFEAWYQPQYSRATGALIGAEALVRWRHPEKGLISPSVFIPVFERNGFIYELDKYIWEKVCESMRRLMDEGRARLPVSVNISRIDVFKDDLVDVIGGLIAKYAIDPELLRLEITESAFAKSTSQIVGVVKRFIDMGFTVEIDDFGSGYSSLNTLKDVPAQVLKLDMRFLEGSDNTGRGGNILESIVRMAKWLGMSVIAEGVETDAQADYLNSIGCYYHQGYLYARPMPLSEYEKLTKDIAPAEKLISLETVDNLNNNSFWDPESMDTLIFNSYVGAAVILELWNGKLTILRANAKFAAELGAGVTRERAMAVDLAGKMNPVIARETGERMRKSILTREEISGEADFFNLLGDGKRVTLSYVTRAIASAEDRHLFYCYIKNITAQKEAEARAAKSADRMRAILKSVRCGICAVTKTEDTVKVLLANEAFYSMLGYTREQFENETAWADYPVNSLDRDWVSEAVYGEKMRVGESVNIVFRADRRDGAVIWVRARVSLMELTGEDRPVLLSVFNDITGEKQAEEKVRALNENLAGLMRDTPGGFCRMRVIAKGRIALDYANENFCRMRGKSLSEMLAAGGTDMLETVHPDDRSALDELVNSMLETGEARVARYRMLCGGGRYVPFNVFGRVTRSDSGETFINAYYTDLSDAEKREMTLHETLSTALSVMMEDSPSLVFVKDARGRYIKANGVMARLLGVKSPDCVVGKTDFDLVAKDFAEKYAEIDAQVIKTGRPSINSLGAVTNEQGVSRYASTSKYPLLDAKGGVTGIFGIGRDVTDERADYERLKLLMGSIPGGVAMYESAAGETHMLYCSDGYISVTGYTRDEYMALAGNDIMCLIFKEDMPAVRAQIAGLYAGADTVDCEYRALTKSGEQQWLRLKGTVMERSGGRIILNAVKLDITAQRAQAEALRIRGEEYRLAIEQSGRLIYRYSHESGAVEIPETTARAFGLESRITDVPDGILKRGLIAPESAGEFAAFFSDIRGGKPSGSMTIRRKVAGGAWRWFSARFSTVRDINGKPVSAIVMFEDVTRERDQQEQYALNRRRFMAALGTIYPVLISVNLTVYTYEVMSQSGILHLGADTGKISDMVRSVAQRMDAEYAAKFRKQFRTENLLKVFSRVGDSLRLEYKQLTETGEHWVEVLILRTQNDFNQDVTGVVVARYIDSQKVLEEKLRLAELDGMTEIYNRMTAEDMINRLLTSGDGKSCALIVADLDFLKTINDSHGHAEGDHAIKLMARLLNEQFGKSGVVGRIGGDEFVAFVSGVTRTRMAGLLSAFMRRLSATSIGKTGMALRGSLGVAMGKTGQDDYEDLFKKADMALYHVKRNGKDDFAFYTPDMEDEAYKYTARGGDSKWQSGTFDMEELDCLLKAVSVIYPMVISVNLTLNTYYMLGYEKYTTHDALNAGTFDDLMEAGCKSFHPDDVAAFRAAFSRENQLAAYKRGEEMISYVGRQKGDDGVYRNIRTDVIFVKGSSEDIQQITLARPVDMLNMET